MKIKLMRNVALLMMVFLCNLEGAKEGGNTVAPKQDAASTKTPSLSEVVRGTTTYLSINGRLSDIPKLRDALKGAEAVLVVKDDEENKKAIQEYNNSEGRFKPQKRSIEVIEHRKFQIIKPISVTISNMPVLVFIAKNEDAKKQITDFISTLEAVRPNELESLENFRYAAINTPSTYTVGSDDFQSERELTEYTELFSLLQTLNYTNLERYLCEYKTGSGFTGSKKIYLDTDLTGIEYKWSPFNKGPFEWDEWEAERVYIHTYIQGFNIGMPGETKAIPLVLEFTKHRYRNFDTFEHETVYELTEVAVTNPDGTRIPDIPTLYTKEVGKPYQNDQRRI